MVSKGCCGGDSNNKQRKCIILFLLTLNAADVIADWFLFVSFHSVQNGLVYGPLSDCLVYGYLAFAIFGSILFLLEIVNGLMEICCGKNFVKMDTLFAVSVWFADLPQITINVIVAACREELLSGFRIAKCTVVIFGCVIPLVFVCCYWCKEESAPSKFRKAVRGFVVIGVLLTCALSIAVFVFSYYDSKLMPHNPNRHFQDVGVFADMNIFFPAKNLSKKTWIKVTDIQTVRNSSKDLDFRYTIENGNNQYVMSLGNNVFSKNLQITNCYRLETTVDVEITTELPVRSCAKSNSTNSTDILFQLRFQEPVNSFLSNPRIFGNIYIFNWNGTNPLRYFGYISSSANESELIFPESNLTDVRDVWRTGYCKCESTGNVAPTLTDRLAFSNN